MNETTKAILDRLDALAVKLGATGEYLWQALVRGAMVDGATQVVMCILVVALIGFAYKRADAAGAEIGMDEKDQFRRELASIDRKAVRVLAAVIAFGGTMIALNALRVGLNYLLAPEAAALKTILGQ